MNSILTGLRNNFTASKPQASEQAKNTLQLTDYSITGKTVRLAWKEPEDRKGVFKEPLLTVRFDNAVDINRDVAAFTFMSVIAPCYHNISAVPFSVGFPETVSRDIIEPIKRYHSLDRLSLPSGDREVSKVSARRTTSHALLYGGGKDSLLSAALQEDLFGAENVTLLRLVWDTNRDLLSQKRAIISDTIGFMEGRGFQHELIESDFHVNVSTRDIGKAPNVALYPGLMAPLLVGRKFKQIAHGYDVTHFHQPRTAKSGMPFDAVRPEKMRILSQTLGTLSGEGITFKDYNYGIHPGIAIKLLAKEYPDYMSNLYMCERLAGKWCIKCRKCFLYALGSLAYRYRSDFQLGYFFQNSSYIRGLLEDVDLAFAEPRSEPPYVKRFAYPTHVCSTIQIAHDIDLDYAKQQLDHPRYPDAYSNLLHIIMPFREFSFPDHDAFWLSAYNEDAEYLQNDQDGSQRDHLIKRFKSAGVPISSKKLFTGYNQDRKVEYRFR